MKNWTRIHGNRIQNCDQFWVIKMASISGKCPVKFHILWVCVNKLIKLCLFKKRFDSILEWILVFALWWTNQQRFCKSYLNHCFLVSFSKQWKIWGRIKRGKQTNGKRLVEQPYFTIMVTFNLISISHETQEYVNKCKWLFRLNLYKDLPVLSLCVFRFFLLSILMS